MTPHRYVARRGTVARQELTDFYAIHFKAISGTITAAGLAPAGPATGVYFAWYDEDQTANLSAAIPIDQNIEFDGFESIVDGGKALRVSYFGTCAGVEAPLMAMDDYLKAHMIPAEGPVV